MLKKAFLVMLVLLEVNSFAAELPIQEKYKIYIENGEFTVFDFPFKIKKTFSSGFLLSRNAQELKKIKKSSSAINIDPRTGKQIIKKNKSIQIKQGNKSLTFLPKARGSFKIVVWGYEKYPLMFDIQVVDKLSYKKKAKLQYYYKFLDYQTNKKKAISFESDPHEKVIVKLIRSLYNNKVPSGYENVHKPKQFSDEVFSYNLNLNYVGVLYSGEEWYIKNDTNKNIKLYEEMFEKKGVYAIAFENDILNVGATTRMFIIRRTKTGERR